MASLRDYRRKLKSVKSTRQITMAMRMIAASRLRRAQERIFGARPFAQKMQELISDLYSQIIPEQSAANGDFALFFQKGVAVNTNVYIVLTTDKGLCGAFNANIFKTALELIGMNPDRKAKILVVGRKGRDFLKRTGVSVAKDYVNIGQPGFVHAELIYKDLMECYSANAIDTVFLIYGEFISMLTQRPKAEQLLPLRIETSLPGCSYDFIYEPEKQNILEALLPRYIKAKIYKALLESSAAELGARMVAMDTATRNADDLISSLLVAANKLRQSSITKEILEVVSGAEALQ